MPVRETKQRSRLTYTGCSSGVAQAFQFEKKHHRRKARITKADGRETLVSQATRSGMHSPARSYARGQCFDPRVHSGHRKGSKERRFLALWTKQMCDDSGKRIDAKMNGTVAADSNAS